MSSTLMYKSFTSFFYHRVVCGNNSRQSFETHMLRDLVTLNVDLFENTVICIVLSEVILMGEVVSRRRIEKLRNKFRGGNKTAAFCKHLLKVLYESANFILSVKFHSNLHNTRKCKTQPDVLYFNPIFIYFNV